MRKFLLLLMFFVLAPTLLVMSSMLLASHANKIVLGITTGPQPTPFAFAALPMSDIVFEGSATLRDKRPLSLNDYLTQYHSPLTPYADLMVHKADEYGIDYRLLTAIAMQETTLCKKTLKEAQYNCWGFGIWGKHATGFVSYEDAIDTISHYFANRREKGIDTLDAIGKIYNPGNTNHWKENVAYVMEQL